MENLKCMKCNEPYNQYHRQKIDIPCGDDICLQCFDHVDP